MLLLREVPLLRTAHVAALALAAVALLPGCLSLPPPERPERATPYPAPAFRLPSTGPQPETSLGDLTNGTSAVLVFYRGDW